MYSSSDFSMCIHSYCRHDHWQNLSSLVPWSDFDLDLWSSSNVVGAVTTFSLGLMLIKVKVTGEIIQLATLLHYFNTLWLCHQQLASLLPLNFKVAFSYNKPFIIKIFLFGFTQAFEISFISEVAAVAEHTTINPLSEWETTSNKQKNELNHKTLISWPDRDIKYWWKELTEWFNKLN